MFSTTTPNVRDSTAGQSSGHKVTKRLESDPPEFSRQITQIVLSKWGAIRKWSWRDPEVISEWFRSDLRVIPNRIQFKSFKRFPSKFRALDSEFSNWKFRVSLWDSHLVNTFRMHSIAFSPLHSLHAVWSAYSAETFGSLPANNSEQSRAY